MIDTGGTTFADLAHEMQEAQIRFKIRQVVQEELRAAGVMKPQKFLLPMAGTRDYEDEFHHALYAYYDDESKCWAVGYHESDEAAIACECTVTKAQILKAPEWVRVIEKVEVKDE